MTASSATPGPRRSRTPKLAGLLTGLLVSGTVSWATPDGNLLVTLVPGCVTGLLVFLVGRWYSQKLTRANPAPARQRSKGTPASRV